MAEEFRPWVIREGNREVALTDQEYRNLKTRKGLSDPFTQGKKYAVDEGGHRRLNVKAKKRNFNA